jgi:hypothetical protein
MMKTNIYKSTSRAISRILVVAIFGSMLVGVAMPTQSANASQGAVGSVCFDNSSTASYIDLNNSNNAVGTGDFTLEMWAKVPIANWSGSATLVNGHSAHNDAGTLTLFVNGTPGTTNSHIGFPSAPADSTWGFVPADTWFHYAYVRTGNTGKVYVNGIPRTRNGSGQIVTSVTDSTNFTSANFRIGYRLKSTWPPAFTGCLADVALTKSALYSADFSANLPYPSTRVTPADSVIFLKPTAGGFSNTGTGAVPVITGSVTVNSDLPSASGSSTIAISSASISGSVGNNQVLTAVPGAVSNSASYTTTYQWRRAGVAIPGASSSTYTLTSDDIGSGISVTITVQDGSGSAFATSASTAPMAKLNPTLNAWSGVSKNFGDPAFSVTAPTEANSLAGSFTYSSGTPSVISVSGSTLTVAGAGSSVITATFTPTDSTRYNTATTTMTVTVGKGSPTFSAWSGVSKNFGDSAFTVTAPSVIGSVPGTFAYSSGTTSVISVSGSTLTVAGAGNSIITATFTPTNTTNYNTATTTMTVAVGKGSPTFSAWSNVSKNFGDSAFTVTAPTVTGSVPGTFTYSSGTPSVISVSGSTLTVVGAGNSVITATFTPTNTTNYNTATTFMTVTVGKGSPTFSAWSNVSKNFGNPAFTVTAPTVIGSVPGTFTYSSATTSVISVSGTTLTVVGAGNSVITATFTPNDSTNYNTATTFMTVTVGAGSQSITRTSTSPTSPVKSGTYTPAATASSSLTVAITIASGSSSVCSISAGVVTFNTVGSCVIQYSQSGNSNYAAATQVTETLTVGKATPTFSAWSGVSKNFGDSAFTVTAPTVTGSLGGTFTYTSATTSVISVSGTTLTVVGAGNSVITATFTPTDSTNYNTATTFMTVTVGKAVLGITASSHTVAYGAAVPGITPTYSGFVNGDTSLVVTAPTCLTTYTTTTAVGSLPATSCSGATANNYSFTYTAGVITIEKAVQATLVGTAGQSMWAWIVLPFSSIATSGGNGTGTVKFTVASGPCAVSGTTLTAATGGTCSLVAIKEADTNYLEKSSVAFSFTVAKGTPTISQSLPASATTATYGTAVVITATVQYAGTVTFKAGTTEICNSVTANLTATCSWTPNSAVSTILTIDYVPTNTNWYSSRTAAGSLTVNVGKGTPTLETWSGVSKNFGDSPFTVTAPTVTGSVPGTFIYSSATTSVISVSGTTLTVVGAGNSVITATFTPADSINYTSTTTNMTVTVGLGAQTLLTVSPPSVTYGSTISLTIIGGNGGGSNSFVVDSGPCTVSGSALTPTAVGTCMVTGTKAASGNYLAASSSSTAITVTPKGLTVSGLTGVNKEFDRSLTGTVTGTPTLVGVVGSDNVLLGGTPTFTFASTNVGSGITVTASGYTLTGTTATNYTLTQPTVTANITAKAARVAATNTTVAFGAPVTSGVTAAGLISPDAVGSASYTYTGTGTSTPPTAVGVYTVTPSSAVLSTGLIGNYTISYDTATVTILAKYTITYNANGGVIGSSSTTSADFVVGDNALVLPTATREGFNFLGWFTLQSNGVQVTGAYTPTATAIMWAHWIQKSLVGVGNSQKIGTITTLANVGNTYSATSTSGTVAVTYAANALPVGTVIDIYQMADSSRASSMISSTNNYVLSLVIAWLTPASTVPLLSANDALTMVITDSAIKKGAKVYSLIGSESTLLGTATADGSVTVRILEDPEVYIAITKPDAPTGVSATSGGDASTTVSWTAPSDGGSAITGYTATSNAGQTCSSATTSCSVTGLTNGTPYTFTVTATNSIGTSDPSSASSAITPVASAARVVTPAPVVTPPSSGGGGGGGGYVAPTPEPTPTVDPSIAAAAAAKALADAKAAEEKAAAEAKALAEKKAAEEAELLATLKAAQEKADAEALAAAKKVADELAAAQLKAEEELAAAAALKLAEEQRIAAERAAAAKRITTVYSTSAAFKLNKTYTNRLKTNTKKIAAGSTVTCIGYAKSSKTLTYAKAKVVATKQAKALCSSMKKINPTLKTKSIVYPASKAPKTTVNKKWIPVSYRVEAAVN